MKKTARIVFLSCVLVGIFGIFIHIYQDMKNANKKMAATPSESSQIEILTEESMTEEAIEETESYIEDVSPKTKEITLVFAGDVLLSDYVLNNYDESGISGIVSDKLSQEMKAADITMVNQEFPFSTRGTMAPNKQYTFRAEPGRICLLEELGIDIVTIANNHTLDYGEEALLDTLETLEQSEITYVGAGENLDRAKQPETIKVDDKVIGFLAASRVIPITDWNAKDDKPGMLTTYDPTTLVEEIKKTRENCDVVVVYVHWGIERDEWPQEYQRSLAKQYIDAGADMVIGSHPHVLQGFEFYEGKLIAYSLGNYIFGKNTFKTMLLKAVIHEDGNVRFYIVPGASELGYTYDLSQEKEKEAYAYLESISFGAVIMPDGEISQKDAS